ncbi:VWA domain-containing protein [Lentisphaera profundi]|uniref:VWA domain-containing protein n=1 Tax=Lentisphaera profundi TaxID=1658616 RepID=A0ABY7VQT3_9BACT|nr:VWA domain-containing protein [Lentisphaera profundi]WDE95605.1 VWA domain-containing protein [Lentisphaera profundi]
MNSLFALQFIAPKMAILFPVLALLIYLMIHQRKNNKKDLLAFSQLKVSSNKAQSKAFLLCFTVTCLIIALMRPSWGTESKLLRKDGRSVVFVLDISNSMRAEDVYPNRLDKAKNLIAECITSLDEHRVGLVVFAGSASIKCPLTLDYDFFLKMLDSVNYDSVAHGGTRIEDALMKTCDKLFSGDSQQYKDIILISDGGDQGELLDKAIEAVNEKQARLMLIGMGDEKNGAPIPALEGEGYMLHQGREVLTKLESSTMLYISEQCKDAVYLPLGTKQMNLARIYRQISEQQLTQELSKNAIEVPVERFKVFLYLAFISFMLLLFTPHFKIGKTSMIALVFFCSFTSLQAQKLTAEDLKGMDEDMKELIMAQEQEELVETPEILDLLAKLEAQPDSIDLNRDLAKEYIKEEAYLQSFSYYRKAITLVNKPYAVCLLTFNLANAHIKEAQAEADFYTAKSYLKDAIRLYRKIILSEPSLKKAAYNLEITKVYLLTREKQQEEAEERQAALEAEVNAIKELLVKAIADETLLKLATEERLEKEADLSQQDKDQQLIQEQIAAIDEKFSQVEKDFFSGEEQGTFPFAESQHLTQGAHQKGLDLIEQLKLNDLKSPATSQSVIVDLSKALELLNQDQNQQQQDSDGESEEGEEGDEYEESDEEGEEGDDEAMPDSSKVDLGRQELPPPAKNPQDIIKMEQELQKIREANKKPAKRSKVDKDW